MESHELQKIPVDVYMLAKERGIVILQEENPAPVRGSVFKINGIWHITVDPDDTIERQNFTIAHEIAETELYDAPDLSPDEKHVLANRIAGELLLPDDPFKNDVWIFNLIDLKMRYPHCSYEVIARRSLSFRNRVLTIFDNGRLTVRTASEEFQFPRQCTDLEKQIADKCYSQRKYCSGENDFISCEGCYVNAGRGVLRVILLTELRDEVIP